MIIRYLRRRRARKLALAYLSQGDVMQEAWLRILERIREIKSDA